SLDGTTMAVGAPNESDAGGTDQGAAYIFTQSGGNWTLQARVVASNGAADAHFGSSVSVQGNTLVVGAPDVGPGAAYVFVRSGTAWSQQAQLTATEPVAGDLFG